VTPVCGFGNDPCGHAYDASTGQCDAMCARGNNENCSTLNVSLSYHDDRHHAHPHAHHNEAWLFFEVFVFVWVFAGLAIALYASTEVVDYPMHNGA